MKSALQDSINPVAQGLGPTSWPLLKLLLTGNASCLFIYLVDSPLY